MKSKFYIYACLMKKCKVFLTNFSGRSKGSETAYF